MYCIRYTCTCRYTQTIHAKLGINTLIKIYLNRWRILEILGINGIQNFSYKINIIIICNQFDLDVSESIWQINKLVTSNGQKNGSLTIMLKSLLECSDGIGDPFVSLFTEIIHNDIVVCLPVTDQCATSYPSYLHKSAIRGKLLINNLKYCWN